MRNILNKGDRNNDIALVFAAERRPISARFALDLGARTVLT